MFQISALNITGILILLYVGCINAEKQFNPYEFVSAKFFLEESEQSIFPKAQCFRAELPRDNGSADSEQLNNEAVVIKWVSERLTARTKGDNKQSYKQLIPACPSDGCLDIIFGYEFPATMIGTDIDVVDSIVLLTQKTILVNYPHSCNKCMKALTFIASTPPARETLNSDDIDSNVEQVRICWPIVRSKSFILNAEQEYALEQIAEEALEKARTTRIKDPY